MMLSRLNEKTYVIDELRKELDLAYNKLKQLESISSDAIWDWDVNNNTIKWNDGIRTIFGFQKNSNCLNYESWNDNIHPSEKIEISIILQQAIDKQKPSWEALYRFRCYNGSYKYTYNRGQIIYQDGVAVQVINAMQDIDERMNYVHEVEKLSLVASKTENLVIMTDGNGIIEWVNEGFEKKMQYQFSEIIGRSTDILTGPETDMDTLNRVRKNINAGKPVNEELLMYSREHQKFWLKVEITPVFDDAMTLSRYIYIGTDVNQYKTYEKKITSIAQELADLIKNASAIIVGIDLNYKINEWNTSAHSLTGYSRKSVIGKELTDFISMPERDNQLEIILTKGLNGEEISHYELPILLKNGQSHILLISTTPRKNSSSEVVGLTIVGQDITELIQYRNELEEKVTLRTSELNIALENEKQLSMVKTRFAAIVSHEFRTPLSTIRLAANYVRRYQNKITPEVIDEKINTIIEQVEQMTHLLEDVLTLGRSQDVKIQVQKTRVDLVAFCKTIKEQVEDVFDRSHSVVCSFTSSELYIESDEGLLRNIFVNLLSNAIKFSPDKSIVYVDVHENDSNIEYVIRDLGIGIHERELENIFEPFDRGSNTNGISGTGLGLSIVKKALDLLDASISVTSLLGKGSIFTITLPKK